ncbi:hypothetical protein DLJ53_03150 [Acuticoccus sediminis]|uniref:L,D-TPase catalytic domain-containing protein n=1 Tax=Acuticoccus sediminis TaxID=2184697 RepID=A0A8B2P4J7_9HYPH|nr:L,D-transpeptidase family protein [Acuticoccus sediminis]RAI03509.1 hypothetical protein DLJ53_03150 [Acuticoccus sediminis]
MTISRRAFGVTTPFALAACVTRDDDLAARQVVLEHRRAFAMYSAMYAAIDTEPFAIPAIDVRRIAPHLLQQEVPDPTGEPAGTTEPSAIGTMVSSGCVRPFNQDIIDLYARLPVGTRVVVLPALSAATS